MVDNNAVKEKAARIKAGIEADPLFPSDGGLKVVVQVARTRYTKTTIRARLKERHEGKEGGLAVA